MLYLLGGAPRLGKRILAERMHERRGVPMVSTDDLYVELQGHSGMQFSHVFHSSSKLSTSFPLPSVSILLK